MVTLEKFNPVLRLFKFVGFAPINLKETNMKLNNFINLFPVMLTSVLSLSVTYYLLLHPHFESYGPIHHIINYSSLISLSLIIITANVKCYFYKTTYRNITYQIYQMEKKIYKDFSVKLTLLNHYRIKVLLIFILFFLSQGLVLYEAWLISANGALSAFFTSSLRSMFPIAVIHVVMYSDIIAKFIEELNRITKNSSTCSHVSSRIELLKNIKTMHLDLWKILVKINKFFGWNLIFLIMFSFIYITYQLYWIFITLQNNWDKLGITGMLS